MNKLSFLIKNTSLSAKAVVISLSAILTVLINMKAALLGLFILITIDLITGIAKSLKEHNRSYNPLKLDFWKSIKSYLLRKTWRKAYEYGIGILVVVIFETLVFGGGTAIMLMSKSFTFSELAIVLPALIEVWSIFENLEAITKNNVLKKLATFLPRKVQKVFEDEGVRKVPTERIPKVIKKVINEELE